MRRDLFLAFILAIAALPAGAALMVAPAYLHLSDRAVEVTFWGGTIVTIALLAGAAALVLRRNRTQGGEPNEQNPSRGPTLEATDRSKIDATGAVMPGDLPFQFARADGNSLIDMPGTVITRQEDGSFTMLLGAQPVQRTFAPPTGEFSQLSNSELGARVLELAGQLRAADEGQTADYNQVMQALAKSAHMDGMPTDEIRTRWAALAEKYRPANDHFATVYHSLASECLARVQPISSSALPPEAVSGSALVFHARFVGPRPCLYAAAFLKAIASRLPAI